MITRRKWKNQALTISHKNSHITISIGGPETAMVLSYDHIGRLWSVFRDGISYRRGLNGRIMAKLRDERGRQRWWLNEQEIDSIIGETQQIVASLHAEINDFPADLRQLLACAANFTKQKSQSDIANYHSIYQPVGILPPDQYLALVLQMTEGCAFNTCTFCDFYKDRKFRIKSPDELRKHALAVKEFLGEGITMRRSIFLGDANSLVVPMQKLIPLLDTIHEVFDLEAMGGLYAFLDGFSGNKKSSEDYRELVQRGLKRVYIGMESGHASLLQFLQKPGQPKDVIEAVRSMKQGGLSVAVIVLIGAGGRKYAEDHVSDTVQAINAMQLDSGDLIYSSELVLNDDLSYAQTALEADLKPLSHEECLIQAETIRERLEFGEDKPRISRYDIREFIY